MGREHTTCACQQARTLRWRRRTRGSRGNVFPGSITVSTLHERRCSFSMPTVRRTSHRHRATYTTTPSGRVTVTWSRGVVHIDNPVRRPVGSGVDEYTNVRRFCCCHCGVVTFAGVSSQVKYAARGVQVALLFTRLPFNCTAARPRSWCSPGEASLEIVF